MQIYAGFALVAGMASAMMSSSNSPRSSLGHRRSGIRISPEHPRKPSDTATNDMRIQDKRSGAERGNPARLALTGSILVYEGPSEQLFVIDEDRSIFAAIPREELDIIEEEEEQLMRENGWLDDWFGKDKDKEKGKDNPKGEAPFMTLSALRASTSGNDRDGFSQSTGWWDDWFGNGDKKKPNRPPSKSPIGKNPPRRPQYARRPSTLHPTYHDSQDSNPSGKSVWEELADFALKDGFGFVVGFLSAATLAALLVALKYMLYEGPPEYEKLMAEEHHHPVYNSSNEKGNSASSEKSEPHKGSKKKYCAKPVVATWYHQV